MSFKNKRLGAVIVAPLTLAVLARAALHVPGWTDTLLIDAENPASWQVESNNPAGGGNIQSTPGVVGAGMAFHWTLGTGQWTQAKYTFSSPVNLSGQDLIGVSLKGDGQADVGEYFQLLFADTNNVFYNYDFPRGIHLVNRWMTNLSIPKENWRYAFGGGGGPIDWSHINRVFLTVQKGTGPNGLSGVMSLDQFQAARSADWSRATAFETVSPHPTEGQKALDYIRSQQKGTGLIVSWKEEPTPHAWLYDQALGLLALSRAGTWAGGQPQDAFAQSATSLARFLVQAQKTDGRWARDWNPNTGAERTVDNWVGDQSWTAMALTVYANKSGDDRAAVAARKSGQWIAGQLDGLGKAADSSEGNIDVWWALRAVNRGADADRVLSYLNTSVWNPSMGYFKGGYQNPFLALDVNTWGSAIARAPGVDDPARALAAVTFAGKTLAAQSDNGLLIGLDGQGPVSLWNEGTAQYASSEGPGADQAVSALVSQQRTDGSLPGSPNSWSSPYGWLTLWSGLAPTAWFTFALNGRPFLMVPSYTASSNAGSARLAFDQEAGSQWTSAAQDNESLTADFGVTRSVDKIAILWGDTYATRYRLEASLDGQTWAALGTVLNGQGGAERVILSTPVQLRFVRLVVETRSGSGGVALRELTLTAGVAVASSEQSGLFPASFAMDGDPATRWSSKISDQEWILFDLGTARAVGGLLLTWDAGYASAYSLRTSVDGRNWEDASVIDAGNGGEDRVSFSPRDARYMEVRMSQRGTSGGYSLREAAPLEAMPFWASSSEGPGLEAERAVDGNSATRWSSQASDPQWLAMSLGGEKTINQVLVEWGDGYARSYQVQVSLDGNQWATVFGTQSGDGGQDVIHFSEQRAKFVRIYGFARGTASGYSVVECVASFGAIPDVPSAASFRVYPNPFRRASGTFQVTIAGMTPGAVVTLYTLTGERVRELWAENGTVEWDGANAAGRTVASGVYLGVAEINGDKKRFRLAVEQ